MTTEKKMPTLNGAKTQNDVNEVNNEKNGNIVKDSEVQGDVISNLKKQIEDLQTKNGELEKKLIYIASEYENSKKRNAKDLDDTRKFAISKFAVEIVNVFDILQKALENIDEKKTDKLLFEGVKMTISEFENIFEKMQISKIEPEIGSVFDHNKQEAVSRVSSELEAGAIVQVIRCGYELYGRLLRPAIVIVSGGQ